MSETPIGGLPELKVNPSKRKSKSPKWIWGQAEHNNNPAPVCSKCGHAVACSSMDDHKKECWVGTVAER